METILLPVKAKHFKDASFIGIFGMCSLEAASSDMFNTEDVSEYVTGISVSNEEYDHERYTHETFDQDYEIAASHNFDDTLIRTITLSK